MPVNSLWHQHLCNTIKESHRLLSICMGANRLLYNATCANYVWQQTQVYPIWWASSVIILIFWFKCLATRYQLVKGKQCRPLSDSSSWSSLFCLLRPSVSIVRETMIETAATYISECLCSSLYPTTSPGYLSFKYHSWIKGHNHIFSTTVWMNTRFVVVL